MVTAMEIRILGPLEVVSDAGAQLISASLHRSRFPWTADREEL